MIRQLSLLLGLGVPLILVACGSEDAPAGAGGAAGASSVAGASAAGTPATGGSAAGGPSTGGSAGAGGAPHASAGSASGGAGGAGGGGGASAGASGAANGGAAGTGGSVSTDPGTEGDGKITVRPPYPRSPDLGDKGAPAGRTFEFDFTTPSYPGERHVTVVIPAQYEDGKEAPFMIATDGLSGVLREAARNLAVHANAERRIPPLVLVGITPGSQRSVEYDTVSDKFWKYVTSEILPAVLGNGPIKAAYPNLKLTSNPSGRGAYGCSSGAPAVMGMAWFGDFTRLLTYSGTFVDLRPSAMYPDGAWEYAGMVQREPVKPGLRMFLHVSENDNVKSGSMGSWKTSNETLAAALDAKGYHYRFVYSEDSGHCDADVIRHTLPDALVWLWRGYQAA